MVKGNYLIVDHMWWCRLVVGKGTREADVVGSNPSNIGKNRATCDLQIFFWFLFTLQIFILAHKRMMPVTYVNT